MKLILVLVTVCLLVSLYECNMNVNTNQGQGISLKKATTEATTTEDIPDKPDMSEGADGAGEEKGSVSANQGQGVNIGGRRR